MAAAIPYVAFGGGEPLGVPHSWALLELLTAGGIALKLETDGRHIDDDAADRLAELSIDCVQISVDGANAETHGRVRPGSDFEQAIAAIKRLVARDLSPQCVFVPTRLNIHEMLSVYDLARALGCEAFVTGPMMRIGRAATNWERLACGVSEWYCAVGALEEHDRSLNPGMRLRIYPRDIVAEMERRLDNPQAMLLVVPDGQVKLLNALPFVVADLRRESVADAWRAYCAGWAADEVRDFVLACRADPELLRHANATWLLRTGSGVRSAALAGPEAGMGAQEAQQRIAGVREESKGPAQHRG